MSALGRGGKAAAAGAAEVETAAALRSLLSVVTALGEKVDAQHEAVDELVRGALEDFGKDFHNALERTEERLDALQSDVTKMDAAVGEKPKTMTERVAAPPVAPPRDNGSAPWASGTRVSRYELGGAVNCERARACRRAAAAARHPFARAFKFALPPPPAAPVTPPTEPAAHYLSAHRCTAA
jgi:hypothetical protein